MKLFSKLVIVILTAVSVLVGKTIAERVGSLTEGILVGSVFFLIGFIVIFGADTAARIIEKEV